jgi:hypothetical protein
MKSFNPQEVQAAGSREPEEYEWAEFNLPQEMLGSADRDDAERLTAPGRED